MRKLLHKPKIGLALSGGAARGLAHIGVIKVLEEHDIPISCVAGTSVGSIIGALFAAGMRAREMAEAAHRIKWHDLVRLSFRFMGIARHAKLKEILENLIGERRFEDLPIPFAAVAVDIGRGEEVVLDSGPLAEAVRASSSIPGIFEPTVIGDRYLVDGGLLNNVPCDVVRGMGADLVIAVDLNATHIDAGPPKNILDVLFRSFQIILNKADGAALEADVLIMPDMAGKSFSDLKHIDEYIECGEEAAQGAIGAIKKKAKLKQAKQ